MRPHSRAVGPSLVRLARGVAARIFRPTPAEEVDEELDFHIEMTTRRNLGKGMPPEEARLKAVGRFGDLEGVKAKCRRSGTRRQRKMDRSEWLQDLGRDVRFAFRQLRKNPGFAAVVILTLAVGIGGNTAVFSVVNGVLLRPLPYPESHELVRAWSLFLPESGYEGDQIPVSPREAIEYRRATTALESLAFYAVQDVTVTGDGVDAERLRSVAATAALLPLLEVRPQLGRWFSEEETRLGSPPVVLLGHDVWVGRFGGDPGVVGSVISLEGTSVEVVGVMPPGFSFPEAGTDLYLSFQHDEGNVGGWGGHGVSAVGRLAPGYTFQQAEAELAGLVERWREEYGHPQVGHTIYLVPLRTATVQAVSDTLWLLLGAVALVLFIASANVANLLMARNESRVREVSLRVALGAGRFRIARQLLAESVVLSGLGALLGFGLAAAAVPAILLLNPDALPRSESIGMDMNVMVFTAAAALGSALLFGLAPALQAEARPGSGDLTGTARVAGSSRGRRVRKLLIISEVALSLLVVVSAGLVTRSLQETLNVEAGMATEGRLTFSLALPSGSYSAPEEVRSGIRSALERLESVPGVVSASFASTLPLTGERHIPDFLIEGRPRPREGERMTSAVVSVITPGHTETLGIPLLQGRRFQAGDRNGTELVALISRETARVFWPDQDPVGQRIGFLSSSQDTPWVTVVGIVEDTHTTDLQADLRPQIYLPHGQEQGFWAWNERSGSVAIRTSVDPISLVPSVRRAMAETDPNLPLADVRTLEDIVRTSVAEPRMASALLGSFGLMALLLAMVGVYGVVSYSVARRTREIGIRVALGADKGTVVGLMVWEGAAPALVGVVLGILGALAAGSLLEGMLFRVAPTDPTTLMAVSSLLAAVSVLASWIPSRRATLVAPTAALREG